MASRANVTLTDAATTPVNRVFTPIAAKGDVMFWKDRTTTSVSIGQNTLSLQQRVPTKQSKSYKGSWKIVCPILEQTSASTATGIQPAPTLAYENLAVLEFVVNERSTLQERKDLLAMTRDLINEALVTLQVHDLEITY